MPYVTYRLSKVLLYRIFRIAKAQKNAAGPTEALGRHPRNFSALGEVIGVKSHPAMGISCLLPKLQVT